MDGLADIENQAGICRITCGWRKPGLKLDAVRRYWRDVHSPAIARRAGIYDYRHFQFAPVMPDLLPAVSGIGLTAPDDAQLQWLSDVRYRDEAALALFGTSPDGEAKTLLLQDIEKIVEQSTTYKSTGDDARTLLDTTVAAPQGPPSLPRCGLFFRSRTGEAEFRDVLRRLAARWARLDGVRRVRLSLLDAPDMEAEKRGGYPIKTHPVERQYQAWIDLVLDDAVVGATLLDPADPERLAASVAEIHCYPVDVSYCFNYDGRPTLVGLRGYPAWEAIEGIDAGHAKGLALLRFMYGDHAQEGLQA